MNLSDALDPASSDEVRAVAAALAGIERDLHEAIQDHYEALGIEPPADREPADERVEQLGRLVDYHLRDDLWGYFVAEQAPEGLQNPEKAEQYAGMDDERWQETIQEWADGEEGSAADVVRERFGVELDTFETRVVEWTPERTLRMALRGRVDTDIERLRVATEALKRSG